MGCKHEWVETTEYWTKCGPIYKGSGKVFARCLMCDEKMPSIEWYEFPQEAHSFEQMQKTNGSETE